MWKYVIFRHCVWYFNEAFLSNVLQDIYIVQHGLFKRIILCTGCSWYDLWIYKYRGKVYLLCVCVVSNYILHSCVWEVTWPLAGGQYSVYQYGWDSQCENRCRVGRYCTRRRYFNCEVGWISCGHCEHCEEISGCTEVFSLYPVLADGCDYSDM